MRFEKSKVKCEHETDGLVDKLCITLIITPNSVAIANNVGYNPESLYSETRNIYTVHYLLCEIKFLLTLCSC